MISKPHDWYVESAAGLSARMNVKSFVARRAASNVAAKSALRSPDAATPGRHTCRACRRDRTRCRLKGSTPEADGAAGCRSAISDPRAGNFATAALGLETERRSEHRVALRLDNRVQDTEDRPASARAMSRITSCIVREGLTFFHSFDAAPEAGATSGTKKPKTVEKGSDPPEVINFSLNCTCWALTVPPVPDRTSSSRC